MSDETRPDAPATIKTTIVRTEGKPEPFAALRYRAPALRREDIEAVRALRERRSTLESLLASERRDAQSDEARVMAKALREDEEKLLEQLRDREPSAALDPFALRITTGDLEPPYVDPLRCARIAVESDILTRVLIALAQGIAGHGYMLEPFYDAKALKALEEADPAAHAKVVEEMGKEDRRLRRFFRHANPKIPFERILFLWAVDRDKTGTGYLEVIPDGAGNIAGFSPLESAFCRLGKQSEPVDAPMPVQGDDGQWTEISWPRAFAAVVQWVNGRMRWFKEFGDPRVMDRDTGMILAATDREVARVRKAEVSARAASEETLRRDAREAGRSLDEDAIERGVETAAAEARTREIRAIARAMVAEGRAATPAEAAAIVARAVDVVRARKAAHAVIVLRRDEMAAGLTHYGIPWWYSATPSVLGRSAAAVVNYTFFDNNAVPDLLLMVDGGAFSKQAHAEIENILRSGKGRENMRGQVVVLEALPHQGTPIPNDDSGKVRIHVERLRQGGDDALFQTYSKDTKDDVRRVYGLPPISIGDSTDYNRATAEVAKELAEQLVYGPERIIIEHVFNAMLFPAMGVNFWTFRLRPAPSANLDLLVGLLKTGLESSGLSANDFRAVAERHIGHPLPPIDAAWAQGPALRNIGIAKQGGDFTIEETSGSTGDDTTSTSAGEEAAAAAGTEVTDSGAGDSGAGGVGAPMQRTRSVVRVQIPAAKLADVEREVATHGHLVAGGAVVNWLLALRRQMAKEIAARAA